MGSTRIRFGLVSVVLAAACAWPAAGPAQVLYRTSGRISRLTASGARMAWAERVPGSHCTHIMRRRIAGAAPTRVTKCRLPSTPLNTSMHTWVRLIGAHVFWDETGRGNTELDSWVYSTLPGGRRSPATYVVFCGVAGASNRFLGPVATGGLVYSVFSMKTDSSCDFQSGTGVLRRTVVAGGAARRVLVPGAPGADMLAVSGRDLLEVPAVVTTELTPGPTLELRGLVSGTRRWSAQLTGTARAVALSPSYAAALVRTASGAIRVRAYSLASGAVVRAIPVRSTVLPMLAMVGPRIVFAYPGRIMAWNVRANSVHLVQRTRVAPHNLLADGRLVAWNTLHTIRGVRLAPAR